MSYYKKILYMDYCERGNRIFNAGFIKLWKKRDDEQTNLQLNISNLTEKDTIQGEIKLSLDEEEKWRGQIEICDGRGMLQICSLEEKLQIKDVREESIRLEILLGPDRTILCEWGEENKTVKTMSESAIETEIFATEEKIDSEPLPVEEALPEEVPSMPIRNENIHGDKWRQLWEFFPHISPFRDEREYLQLGLTEMIILPKMYYRLVENSFLLHGFYNYEHLILTRVRKKGVDKYYIGVPGNYYEREKQVAVLFGFESFEPRTEPAAEGDFGYYLISVDL